jgi:ubiquinone/menaquinone biosynthesis C-methylase UbiE
VSCYDTRLHCNDANRTKRRKTRAIAGILPEPSQSLRMEILDSFDGEVVDLSSNLRDIRRLNKWFGGTQAALALVRRALADSSEASLLDVATGSADIPLRAHEWARRAGVDLRITGMDISPGVLSEATRITRGTPISLQVGDARAMPLADCSYDVVMSCLALHHFPPEEAVIVLREMWRVARRVAFVVDLTRSYPALAGTYLATRTVARNRVTRHDGPLSVRRSYTRAELLDLSARAEWKIVFWQSHFPFRQSIFGSKVPQSGDGHRRRLHSTT